MDKSKRRRLAKACDGCHKSKRRCDGTDPCSNCYFAAKPCTYTDSSGRPVPPPRNTEVQPTPSQNYQYPRPAPAPYVNQSSRKRSRIDLDCEALDPLLTRELLSLFYAHNQPVGCIIHKPTLYTALAHDQVPLYLLHAMCALAARFSKQPSLRTTPRRRAGRVFADAAIDLMFDPSGCLRAPETLQTAQALCLLFAYEIVAHDEYKYDTSGKDKSHSGWLSGERFRAVALNVIENMNVHAPEHPLVTPVPSPSLITESIARECGRRIFWLVYILDCIRGIYFGWEGGGMSHISASTQAPNIGGGVMGYSEAELRLRLPVDETSFELGTVHQSLPEYLYLPAVRTHYASEMGHLVRIVTICQKIEWALDAPLDPKTRDTVTECEKLLDEWSSSLPSHLLFSTQILAVQRSLFETESNFSAWCYATIHVYYASCSLALIVARQRFSEMDQLPFHIPDINFILDRVYAVNDILLGRAKNSLILGIVIWPLVKYINLAEDPEVITWIEEFDDLSGMRIDRLIRDRWGSAGTLSSLCLRQSTPSTPMALPPPTQRTDSDIDPSLMNQADNQMYSAPCAPQKDKRLLPSLKASGLLEWSNPVPSSSVPLTPLPDRRGTSSTPSSADPVARSLPMGMSWLANDAR